ncbi:hypothetical protein KHS38_03980 [Mucilaginibacter sp. Bleaf8]|uniref:hypothetical protein n=1 Tax=Mucilaginibacter sp. Bleaf8 TaxID=2834430 RepID=UPI001BCF1672|nr:hypothetical protein [Mucilaginibacter sp. Bleaf8]MBS7563556.1 hypothetical protein [Mucilaginibacter sp. Bleaf8]
MSFRTLVSLVITICLTILIVQNTDEAVFTIFFVPVKLAKVAVLTSASVGGFLVGVLVSRPKRRKSNDENSPISNVENTDPRRSDTLSDEDREYIS